MELPLSKDLYNQLCVLHKQIKKKKDADRLKIILLSHAGYNQKQIASILFMNENTISYWIKNFKNCTDIDAWLKKTTNHIGEN